MTAVLTCGPCGESYPLAANTLQMRRTCGLPLVTVACPSCHRERSIEVSQEVYDRVWPLWAEHQAADERAVRWLRLQLDVAGDEAATKIGEGR